MSKKKWFLLALVAVTAFTVGYGAVAQAFPTPYNYGYFKNQYDNSGIEVLPPWGGPNGCQGNGLALPTWVDTADEFLNFITCKLGGDYRNHIGAAFIISTMIGEKNDYPTSAQIDEFTARVRYAAANGMINFNVASSCVVPNTYYQNGPADVAAYGGCGTSSTMIAFNGGSTSYIIKRYCANPVGSMAPIPDDVNFNMTGTVDVDDSSPLPGQTIRFDYAVTNDGPTASDPYNVWWAAVDTINGGQPIPGHPTGTYPVGRTDRQSENYPIPAGTSPGTQICRRVDISPANTSSGTYSSPPECATVRYDYTLTPSITVQVNGVTSSNNVAEQGDAISFIYAVRNNGETQSHTVTCTYRQASYTGYNTTPPVSAFTPSGSSCAPTQVFPPRVPNPVTSVATETVPASPGNTSICRSFTINPITPGGGSSPPVVACAFVTVKPYMRVYGGDVTAGGGIEASPDGSCDYNNAAAIGWNRRNAPVVTGWAGAGVQYATYAAGVIFDLATGMGNPAGAGNAPKPRGLAFRNNTGTNQDLGNFGGLFGSVPCISDYYSGKPASAPAVQSDVGAMATGSYYSAGPITLHGTIGSSFGGTAQRVVVYVDGDVLIDGDIQYPANWSSGNAPALMVVALGNIHISRTVQRIDGSFVAQPLPNGSKGIIYTCSTPTLPTLPHTSLFIAQYCGAKLTVNGAFAARQIQFLRTGGTLRSSNAAEASTSANIAEVFNYSPALWMAQPVNTSGASDYDAINSLPPVL